MFDHSIYEILAKDCRSAINYSRRILDDTQKLYYFYKTYLENNPNTFYIQLSCGATSQEELRNHYLKRFYDNYLRHTSIRLCGLIEHNGNGGNFHLHGALDSGGLTEEELKKEFTQHWADPKNPQKRKWIQPPEQTDPLRYLLYTCKHSNRKKLPCKNWAGVKSNLYYCNLGRQLPWANKVLPSHKFHRPTMPDRMVEHFKTNWGNPRKGEQTKFPSLISGE